MGDLHGPEVSKMIKVNEQAVERVSEELIRCKYNLKELFKRIEDENPRVAEYIQCQANKSKSGMEIIGTGVVVYLLIKAAYGLQDDIIGSEKDWDALLKVIAELDEDDLES
jgi:hypothetical protein